MSWIKVESGTPNKPEVLRISRLLDLDKDAVVGKLLKIWAWFDENSVDGVVSQDVDALVDHQGFAVALSEVNWLEFDDHLEQLRLPNFNRHNGETAKKRALKSRRQKKWRENSVDTPASTTASTREDKRRNKEKVKKENSSFIPPTVEEVRQYIQEKSYSIDPQQFVDYYSSTGWMRGKSKIKNWKSCVGTWVRNQKNTPSGEADYQDQYRGAI